MRIWDLPPKVLCRKHLLAEHRELHAVWTVITQNKKGYRHHPETKRWQGKLKALFFRHQELVAEMRKRGYRHLSPLDKKMAQGKKQQKDFVNTLNEQKKILKSKNCFCKID